MSTTTTTRLTPLLRNTTFRTTSRLSSRPIHRSLSCQGHSASRFASTNAFSSITKSQLKPERAAADWGKQVRKVAGQAIIYFPFYATILGWPFLAKGVVNWSRGL